MRILLMLFSLFLVALLFRCKEDNASNDKNSGLIGMDISKTNIQEYGSCDSIGITALSQDDSLFFLFRIPPNACSSCYNREISTIKDFFTDDDFPIIVSSFDNCRDFLAFGSNYDLNPKEFYNSTSLIKTLDKQSIPYYLFLDSSFIVKDVFITRKNDHLSTIQFLSNHSSPGVTQVKFDTQNVKLKLLKKGVPESATFLLTNIGNKPLIIYHIESSCGCTKTDWPKKPIKPNEQGEILVTYDAKNVGRFRKTLTLFCNTPKGVEILSIEGNVE
ncbi:DUF1573 domain-containing protein [Geofilum sp. OHC36d9]|uniref:DUF1573 domain-containing protein n=1 Tax=Geofilum sp. OHC36d9 TaxID=3458413 RepID=UPI004033F6AC